MARDFDVRPEKLGEKGGRRGKRFYLGIGLVKGRKKESQPHARALPPPRANQVQGRKDQRGKGGNHCMVDRPLLPGADSLGQARLREPDQNGCAAAEGANPGLGSTRHDCWPSGMRGWLRGPLSLRGVTNPGLGGWAGLMEGRHGQGKKRGRAGKKGRVVREP